jgi:hypothetical protein
MSEHIPPISLISSESVVLITTSEPKDLTKKKSGYKLGLEGKNIMWVRVLLSNGDIVFNSYHNHLAKDSKINIWVGSGDQPHISIQNVGDHLELLSDKKFKSDGAKHISKVYGKAGARAGIRYFKLTYATDYPITRFQILIKKNKDKEKNKDKDNYKVVFEFNEPYDDDDAFIKWILIWPDEYRYNLK